MKGSIKKIVSSALDPSKDAKLMGFGVPVEDSRSKRPVGGVFSITPWRVLVLLDIANFKDVFKHQRHFKCTRVRYKNVVEKLHKYA